MNSIKFHLTIIENLHNVFIAYHKTYLRAKEEYLKPESDFDLNEKYKPLIDYKNLIAKEILKSISALEKLNFVIPEWLEKLRVFLICHS